MRLNQLAPDHAAAFVASSLDVLRMVTHIDAAEGAARVQRGFNPEHVLLISIGLSGDVSGQVIFQFDMPTIRLFVSSMCGPGVIGDEVEDAIVLCEVANMIAGHALGRLEDIGCGATITSPEVIKGERLRKFLSHHPVVLVPIESVHGEIGVCLFLEASAELHYV